MGAFESGEFRCRGRVSFLDKVVRKAIFELALVHVVEENLGGIALFTCLLLETFDGAVDFCDGVSDVSEMLNLALEGGVPGEIGPYLLEFIWVRGVIEEFLDSESADGNVDLGCGSREGRHSE